VRILIGFLCGAVLLAGCARHKLTADPISGTPSKPGKTVVTPDLKPVGKVAMVNLQARYVVVNFQIGAAPQPEHKLNVYRNGLKVGELKVDGRWQRDNNTVADLIAGEAQVNDEVRED